MTKTWPPRLPGGVRPTGLSVRPLMRRTTLSPAWPLLLAFIVARVPSSDCDDLHQEIWQRAWVALPGQFQGGNFRAWLHQITRNAIIDLSRKSVLRL